MRHPTRAGIGLVRLGDSDFVPANSEDDVRGKDVYDAQGQHIGSVENLYIDRKDREGRFLEVGAGGFLGIGAKLFLVAVEAVSKSRRIGLPSSQAGRRRWRGRPPSTPRSRPLAQMSDRRATPGCLTATLRRAPPTPRLIATGHLSAVLAGAMCEVTGLMTVETYLLPAQMALCR
jgi:sporulation protein YlmC with PRC-barrel domain